MHELDADVAHSYQAYQAMCESKQAYFELLQSLNDKSQLGNTPSIAENLQLEKLLQQHSQNVGEFNKSMQALTSETARRQLIQLISAE